MFFHTSTLIRRRKNRITALQNEGGEWVEGKENLKNMALKLFTSDPTADKEFFKGRFLELTEDDHTSLEAEFSLFETNKLRAD